MEGRYKYTVYDARTESMTEVFGGTGESFDIRGLKISNESVLKGEYNSLMKSEQKQKEGYYTLVAIIDGNTYKVVTTSGRAKCVTKSHMTRLTESDMVINCTIKNNSIECTDDVWIANTDAEFKRYIIGEYEKYQAKSKLLGNNCNLSLDMIGNDVRVVDYNGASTSIILPNFITVINKEAFRESKISSIKLNKGLKLIGENAFTNSKLDKLVIPDTVEYVYSSALIVNKNFFKINKFGYETDGIISKDRVIMNKNTIII